MLRAGRRWCWRMTLTMAAVILMAAGGSRISAQEPSRDWRGGEVREKCRAQGDDIAGLEETLGRHITQQFRARYKARWGYFPTRDTAIKPALYPNGPYRELVRNLQSREETLLDAAATRRAYTEERELLIQQLRKAQVSLVGATTTSPENLDHRTSWLRAEINIAVGALEGLLEKEAARELKHLMLNLCAVCDNANQVARPAKDIVDRSLLHLRENPPDLMPAHTRNFEATRVTGDGPLADVRTAVLVYDLGIEGGARSVCVWLVTWDGLQAAATIPLPSLQLSAYLQDGLGVKTRAATRVPVPKAAPNAGRSTKQAAVEPQGTEPISDRERVRLETQELATAALEQVAQVLLPRPISEALLHAKPTRVLILPAADLSTIPFSALPVDATRALVDVAELVILTDTDPLLVPQPSPRFERGGQALVVGDPDLADDPKWLFKPLPEARAEAMLAGQVFGVRTVVGKSAAKQLIRAELAKRRRELRLVYFATHGIADAINPMDGSFLALSGGHLYARDIKELRLEQHPLIVMSACQTGLGKVFEGGTFGLTRAWHFAGASQVVMSLWNIDDAATRYLMTDFLHHYQSGARAETALRFAMISSRTRNSDPSLWAGFAVSMGSHRDYRDR
jgi:CHAT domain-containing protein